MARPLTKEIVNQRVKRMGLELIGNYKGVMIKNRFRMIELGYEFNARPINIMKKPDDYINRILICGKGFYGKNYSNGGSLSETYQTWLNMIQRCYDPERLKLTPCYKGCSVCDEWLYYPNFESWALTQDWQGKHLDKDIQVRGNKMYSPNTCLYVDGEVNNLILLNKVGRGSYMKGVRTDSRRPGLFFSQCSVSGMQSYLGTFSSEIEAHVNYCLFKAQHIYDIAVKQVDIKLKDALLRWSTYFKSMALSNAHGWNIDKTVDVLSAEA